MQAQRTIGELFLDFWLELGLALVVDQVVIPNGEMICRFFDAAEDLTYSWDADKNIDNSSNPIWIGSVG